MPSTYTLMFSVLFAFMLICLVLSHPNRHSYDIYSLEKNSVQIFIRGVCLLTCEINFIIVAAFFLYQGYMKTIQNKAVTLPPGLDGKEMVIFGNVHQIYDWHKEYAICCSILSGFVFSLIIKCHRNNSQTVVCAA